METPYYILDKRQLEKNYQHLDSLCKKILKNYQICYSVKTNSLPEVIKILKNQGSSFEVASLNEIKLIPKAFTIFNGPCKTKEELNIAIKNKFLINIDNKQEIDLISKLTKNKKIDIGIRVSIKDSKFGIPINKLKNIILYSTSKNLNPICIHFHQGTQVSIETYEKNLKILNQQLKKLNLKPKYIDIGGGIPSKQQLKNINKTIEDYLLLIKKYLSSSTIILEPGRYLVADSMKLITKVHYIKNSFNKKYAILDAGINLLPKITLARYNFKKISKDNNEKKEQYILAGPLLFSNDIIGKFTGNLKQNDLIEISNVGAYCLNLSWEISYKKPKVLIK